MSKSAAAVVPAVLYQNDVGREPVTHLELAKDQATRVFALQIQRPKSGAELLPSLETLATIERLSRYVIQSGQFKKRFINEAQVIVTLLKGHDLGITFADSLEHVYVVNGKPGVSGQLMLRLIYSRVRNPQNEPMVEFAELTDKKATVRMRRPGGDWVSRSFTIEEATKAGLLYNWKEKDGQRQKVENFVWHAYRQDMLLWRAVARCARIVFSDAIGGVYFYDELLSGPINNPDAVVPGHDPPDPPPAKPKKTRKKKDPKKGAAKKNGLTDEQRDALNTALHRATQQMDPDWPKEISESDDARFRDTRKLVYDCACQAVLEFVPDAITPKQATMVQADLDGRADRWEKVLAAVQQNVEVAGPPDPDQARRELWVEAWKAEAGAAPEPKALASADAALADKMLAGLAKNLERLEAEKKDGEEAKE